jgi:hypothetical protein
MVVYPYMYTGFKLSAYPKKMKMNYWAWSTLVQMTPTFDISSDWLVVSS